MPEQPYGFSTYKTRLELMARKYNVPAAHLAALIQMESSWNPAARNLYDPASNPRGADEVGLFQVVPKDTRRPDLVGKFSTRPTSTELSDPNFNIETGTAIWAAALAGSGGDPYGAYTRWRGSEQPADYQRFVSLVNSYQSWDDMQEGPADVEGAGVTPPKPYSPEMGEPRAVGEPIEDAPEYYEGYWEDLERQKAATASALQSMSAGQAQLEAAQRTASFWGIFKPITVITGWRPAGVERPQPQYMIDYQAAQAAQVPILDQYYLEIMKLNAYQYLPMMMINGDALTPEDAITELRSRLTPTLGEEATNRAVSPQFQAFISDLFNKLSGIRYTPGASCEELQQALISPTRPRPMAFGIVTPAAEILRRQRLPTEPLIAQVATWQDFRDLNKVCGLDPEWDQSVKDQWNNLIAESVNLTSEYEMYREGMVSPRLPSLTALQTLQLAITQPGSAIIGAYSLYYRKANAPLASYAWEAGQKYLQPLLDGFPSLYHPPGARPWEYQWVPSASWEAPLYEQYQLLLGEAKRQGMSDWEAHGWAWQQLSIPGINRFIWEIVFDPANILAVSAGSLAKVVFATTKSERAALAVSSIFNAPNDLLASPMLAGKAMWTKLPKTPFQRRLGAIRLAKGELDKAFWSLWPGENIAGKSSDEIYAATQGFIKEYISTPYVPPVTQNARAGQQLVNAGWRYPVREQVAEWLVKLGVPADEAAGRITNTTMDNIAELWRKIGVSESSALLKPREAATELINILGLSQSTTMANATEKLIRTWQDDVVKRAGDLWKGRNSRGLFANFLRNVGDSYRENWLAYDWRWTEGSEITGRVIRTVDQSRALAVFRVMQDKIVQPFAANVLYFPSFGPWNMLETAFRSHRLGLGWREALFPSEDTFTELRAVAGHLDALPSEFRQMGPTFWELQAGLKGEYVVEDITEVRQLIEGQSLFGISFPGVQKPLRFPSRLVKKYPFLKKFNDLSPALRYAAGWNDWWAHIAELSRADSLLYAFEKELYQAAPTTMKAIDDLMPPIRNALDNVGSITSKERDEIASYIYSFATYKPDAVRAATKFDWRKGMLVQDVLSAVDKHPELEADLVGAIKGAAERGQFSTMPAIDDFFDGLMSSWKQGHIQKLSDGARQVSLLMSQVAGARPTTPDELFNILREIGVVQGISDDLISSTRSAVTEAAQDVASPALKRAMHEKAALAELEFMYRVTGSTEYNYNLLRAAITGETLPSINWDRVVWEGVDEAEQTQFREFLELLPFDMKSALNKVKVDPSYLDQLAKLRKEPPKYRYLGVSLPSEGTVILRESPAADPSTAIHEIIGHGWLDMKVDAGDGRFFAEAAEAYGDADFFVAAAKAWGEAPEGVGKRAADAIRAGQQRFDYDSLSELHEALADDVAAYIEAPEHLLATKPDIYNFIDTHLSPKIPTIPLTDQQKALALQFINSLEDRTGLLYDVLDTVNRESRHIYSTYKGAEAANLYKEMARREWNRYRAGAGRITLRQHVSDRLAAAGYDPLPMMKPISGALTIGDLADASGRTADSIKIVKPHSMLLMSEDEFVNYFRGEAGAIGVQQRWSDDPERAANIMGFTKEAVGRVYRDLIRDIGLEPSTATALSPIEQIVSSVRDDIKLSYSTHMIPEEDVVKINEIIEKAAKSMEGLDVYGGSTPTLPKPKPIPMGDKPFSQTVYRGVSPTKGLYASDPGDLGKGIYYSTSEDVAKVYGKLTTEELALRNPKWLSEEEASALVEKYGTVRGSDVSRLAGAEKLTKDLMEQGYDGLVVAGWDSPKGHYTVVKFPATYEELITGGQLVDGMHPAWKATQEAAMDKAHGRYLLEHVDITNANIVDAVMKSVYPFWTYESQRWPWVFKTFVGSPWVATNMGRYMNYTDRGYIHIPGADLRVNPFSGTIMMGGFSRLSMRDYPEFFDTIPGLAEPLGALMRVGFYPNILVNLPFVIAGTLDRNKKPQYAELMPAWTRGILDSFLAMFPQSEATRRLRDLVFPDRYRDYYTMQIVDKLANERGIGIYGKRLWDKMEQGITLDPDEQALWNEAAGVVAKYAVLSDATGWFSLRPKEREEAFDASSQFIEEMTGIPKALQDEAMRHYAITGSRISDRFPLDPYQRWMLREDEKLRRFMSSYTTPLLPSGWQKQQIRMDDYWNEVEDTWDAARHIGWEDAGIKSLDQLELEFTTGVWREEFGRYIPISASDYRTAAARTLQYAADVVERLGGSPNYKYNMVTHDGVPKTLEERADYYQYHGIPVPTYHPLQELLYSYYDIKPELRYNEDTGVEEYDFDTYYAMTSALVDAIPEPDKSIFLGRLQAEWTPMRRLQWKVSDEFFQPYRAVRDAVIGTFTPEEQLTIKRYARAEAPEKEELRAQVTAEGLGVISQYETRLRTARVNMRLAYPQLDAWLLFWGRTSTTQSPQAQQMYEDLLRQYRPAVLVTEQ